MYEICVEKKFYAYVTYFSNFSSTRVSKNMRNKLIWDIHAKKNTIFQKLLKEAS